MHVDQAVELILKECVRSSGKSIYKNPKETITMWGAYDILIGTLKINIPEKPDLELLHEERNNIQHKYANPSADDAAFHVEKAMGFIRRFSKDELKLDIKEFVPSEYLEQLWALKALSVNGHPRSSTLVAVIGAIGLNLTVEEKQWGCQFNFILLYLTAVYKSV